jgi:hypothetical protein
MFRTTAALLIDGPMITLEAGSINVFTGLNNSFNESLLCAVINLWLCN